VTFSALRLKIKTVFAFHVAGQALQNRREQKSVTVDAFQHILKIAASDQRLEKCWRAIHGRNDTQHYDIRQNDIKQNGIHHNDTQNDDIQSENNETEHNSA
jgi:hypothetical protein